jgi:hypothetical protein
MAKWTKGPWDAREIMPEDQAWGACEIWPDNGDEPVATMVCGVANARLCAAAPEMAEALEKLLADVGQYEAWQRPVHAVDVARAALAKAKGE